MSLHPDLAAAFSAFRRGDLSQARDLAKRDFRIAPSAQADHLLGLIDCRLGEFDAGLGHLRRAVEAEPANPAYRLMLARALIDGGKPAEALTLGEPHGEGPAALDFLQVRAEAASAIGDPAAAVEAWQAIAAVRAGDWRVWNNLGNQLAALEQWDPAISALQKATQLNPREAAIRRNLAAALNSAGLVEEAARQLRTATTLDPTDVEIYLSLARLETLSGRHEASLVALDAAARLAPNRTDIAIGRGRCLTALARFEDAEECYRSALALSPADVTVTRDLGQVLERTSQLDALRQLLEKATEAGIARGQLAYLWAAIAFRDGRADEAWQLLSADSPDAEPVRWHRLRAKVADSRGDAGEAFASASAMNLATADHDEWRRRGAAYRARIRDLEPILTAEWVSKLPQLAPDGRRAPAFLVGFPRSGTTLLDTFLMGHPATEVLEEVHMLGSAELVIGNLRKLPSRSAGAFEKAREAYFAELDRNVDPGFGGLVVDKLPLNMLGMPLIHCLFPGAPVIFAQRHPCDTVLSGFMQSFVLNDAMACFLDIRDAADLYDSVMTVWWRARQMLPLNVQTLVYEDLVADPAAALRPLVGFLGLEWSDALLDHRATAKARGAIATASYDQVTEPLSQRPVGRWRRYQEQLRPVLPVLLPWAEKLGYRD